MARNERGVPAFQRHGVAEVIARGAAPVIAVTAAEGRASAAVVAARAAEITPGRSVTARWSIAARRRAAVALSGWAAEFGTRASVVRPRASIVRAGSAVVRRAGSAIKAPASIAARWSTRAGPVIAFFAEAGAGRTAPHDFAGGVIFLREILHPVRAELEVHQIGQINGIGLAHGDILLTKKPAPAQ